MERSSKRWMWAAAAAAGVGLVLGLGTADAGLGKIQKTFKGQILITETNLDLQKFSTDKENLAYIKKSRKKVIKSEDVGGVPTWSFSYTVFMKTTPKVNSISFDWYTDDKEKLYVANKKLTGIDPKLTLLQGRISISEDDGPVPGRKYIVKVAAEVKGKEVILATTNLHMK